MVVVLEREKHDERERECVREVVGCRDNEEF